MLNKLIVVGLIAVIGVSVLADKAIAASVSEIANNADKSSNKTKKIKRKIKTTPSINLNLHKNLQQAQHLLSSEKTAINALEFMEKIKRSYKKFNSYERAIFWNIYAYIYYVDKNYPKAQLAYEQVLEQKGLPDALHSGTLYNLAQLHFIQKNYRQAVQRLEIWFGLTKAPSAAAYVLLGQGYYQINNYNQAIPAITKAISITRQQNRQIKENWYLLLRAMYYREKAYKETLDVLKLLVREYPKKEYYAHIASLYVQLNLNFEQYSTFVSMADAQLLDKEAELVNYAQLLLQNKRPYRAARLLEAGLTNDVIAGGHKNLRLLASAWVLAKENNKAIPVLEQAAKLSSSGEDYVLLAQSYFSNEAWLKAQEASYQALQKGNLNRPDTAHMLLGMALFYLQKFEESMVQFSKAKQYKRSLKIANQWEQYVTAERARLKSLRN